MANIMIKRDRQMRVYVKIAKLDIPVSHKIERFVRKVITSLIQDNLIVLSVPLDTNAPSKE